MDQSVIALYFVGCSILAFGIIIGLALRAAIRQLADTNRHAVNRLVAFMEPAAAARAQELDALDAEADADEAEQAQPFLYR